MPNSSQVKRKSGPEYPFEAPPSPGCVRVVEVEHACAEPRTTSEVMPVLFKRAFDAQQTFFAMGETLSHLNYLRHRRQLRLERTADGLYRYARA